MLELQFLQQEITSADNHTQMNKKAIKKSK